MWRWNLLLVRKLWMETVEMTTKDRRQDTNLVDKEFERINSSCEESSVGKMPSKGIGHDGEPFIRGRGH